MDRVTKMKESNKMSSTRVILAEIIGATDLQNPKKDNLKSLHPFTVASLVGGKHKHGTQVLQRTKRTKNTANPIWCIEHRCLFLITITKGMLDDSSSYKVQFDVRHKDSSDPFSCTLIGSQMMSLDEIFGICEERAEERIELNLQTMPNEKERLSRRDTASSKEEYTYDPREMDKDVQAAEEKNANLLAVRFRFASSFDIEFMRVLEKDSVGKIASLWNDAAKTINKQLGAGSKEDDNRPKLITEMSTPELGVTGVINMFTKKTSRGRDGVRRIRVQPGPDPSRIEKTTYLSEGELKQEMYEPSSNWIQGGNNTKESLGMVYLEVLECEGLPNMDTGGALGNKTDAFVCAVYEENLVQTDVIDDRLSPMWMPWTQRAFCFHMHHPMSQLFVSVNDFDFGPSPHDGIGRIAVNLNHFESDVAYTLKYKIHPAANVYDREDLGTITIRIRKQINNEKAFLLASLKPSPRLHVNMQSKKTLPVANFTVYGNHNEDHYDIQLLRSYVNEIMELKRFLLYAIGDSINSLVMWRGQVKVGNAYLPIYSLVSFLGGIFIIERPHLIPGCFFLTIAWIMLASMQNRLQHPSPWHKTNSFTDYFSMLMNKEPPKRRTVVKRMENHKEILKYETNWEHRMKTDLDASWKEWELQLECDQIGNEDMNTEVKRKTADPLALALESLKPRIFPIQQRLKGYCKTLRQIKAVTSWEESIISFWVTLICIVIGVALLILPTVFLLHWAFRLLIWIGLGPWTRLYYEIFVTSSIDPFELRNDKDRGEHQDNILENISRKFEEIGRQARLKGEEATKMKAMRVFRFGCHIAKVPRLYLARHYDYPLSESVASHVSIATQHTIPPRHFKSKKVMPAQHLEGEMIPLSEDELDALLLEAGKDTPMAKASKDSCMPSLANKLIDGEKGNEMESLLENEASLPQIEEADTNEYDSLEEFISFDTEENDIPSSTKNGAHLVKDEARNSATDDQICFTTSILSCGTIVEERDDEWNDPKIEEDSDLEEEGVEIIACPESELIHSDGVELALNDGKEAGSCDDDTSCTSKSLSSLYKSSDHVFVSFCR